MSRKSIFIPIFLLSLTIPVFFFVGPLRLSAYRAFLLIGLFPALMIWLTNQKIPKILPDFLILFFPFWAMIALARLYGMGFAVEAGGMFFIETVGPYFIARVLVQNADRFEQIMRWLIGIVIVLLPFAVFEAVTKREILGVKSQAVGQTEEMELRSLLVRIRAVVAEREKILKKESLVNIAIVERVAIKTNDHAPKKSFKMHGDHVVIKMGPVNLKRKMIVARAMVRARSIQKRKPTAKSAQALKSLRLLVA